MALSNFLAFTIVLQIKVTQLKIHLICPTLFRNERFLLDEMFQRNASKLVMFFNMKKSTQFFPNECPGGLYCLKACYLFI